MKIPRGCMSKHARYRIKIRYAESSTLRYSTLNGTFMKVMKARDLKPQRSGRSLGMDAKTRSIPHVETKKSGYFDVSKVSVRFPTHTKKRRHLHDNEVPGDGGQNAADTQVRYFATSIDRKVDVSTYRYFDINKSIFEYRYFIETFDTISNTKRHLDEGDGRPVASLRNQVLGDGEQNAFDSI